MKMNAETKDPKFYEEKYHLEEREGRRRLICNGVFIGYTLVLIVGLAQALFVHAYAGIEIYALLIPYAILSAISFIFWIGYHIYSRRIMSEFYEMQNQ